MSARPPQDWFEKMAAFYGIDMEEANRRYEKVQAQGDDPALPICLGCARHPEEIDVYVEMCMESPTSTRPSAEVVRTYVRNEEGTFNRSNGHFLCDECYIRNGMPSSPTGWHAP